MALDVNNNKLVEQQIAESPLTSFEINDSSEGNSLFRSPHSSESYDDTESDCSTYSAGSPTTNLQTGIGQCSEIEHNENQTTYQGLTYHQLSGCNISNSYKELPSPIPAANPVCATSFPISKDTSQCELDTSKTMIAADGEILNCKKRVNEDTNECDVAPKLPKFDNSFQPPQIGAFIQAHQSMSRVNSLYRDNQPFGTRMVRSASCENWKPKNHPDNVLPYSFCAPKENRWNEFDWNRSLPNQTLIIPMQNNAFQRPPFRLQRMDKDFQWQVNHNQAIPSTTDNSATTNKYTDDLTTINPSFKSAFPTQTQTNHPTLSQAEIPSYPLLTNLIKQHAYANENIPIQGPSNWHPSYDRVQVNRSFVSSPILQPGKELGEIYNGYNKDYGLYPQHDLACFRRLNEIEERRKTKYRRKLVQHAKDHVEYDILVRGLPPNISPNTVFCLVPGRLGIPNKGKRHEVTVSEIVRRVLTPESLNISLLGPILRKAKSKNGSQYLRDKLQEIGIALPQGRRKTAQCTLFTSLTESESGQLAGDFSVICEKEFPSKTGASCVQQSAKNKPFVTNDAITSTLSLLDCFTDILISKHPPSPSNQLDNVEETTNDAMNRQLYNFETLTHGFGIKTVLSGLSVFRNTLASLLEIPKE